MSVDTMQRLYELKNIAGVKDATANMARVTQQRAAMGEDFNQLSGEDITALGFMAHGGHGCISVTSNVAPRLCAEFQAACLRGDFAAALKLQDKLAPLHINLFVETSPAPIKYALSLHRQMRQHAAPADGAGDRKGADGRPPGHGPCRSDQLGRHFSAHCRERGIRRNKLGRRCRGDERKHRSSARGGPMLEEFKKFAMRGNVVDLAVGVIIGAAFGAIVNSLVGDVIMPLIGAVTGGLDFSNYFIPLSAKVTATSLADAKKQGAVLAWGNFVTLVINFLIIAWVLFLAIKGINRLKAPEPPAAAAPSKEVQLLTEIRDLLKSR